ncbi:MAG TPA: thiamine pyrophosphate-dependent enzyme [Candidatus Goldiibacteriota bacterium]|nr:thiamine pyrophosphate-dependent enzyme [Candidatus Goldiibacteriota bacterium]HRQ44293.1 thiamine pyrophosphate-dependent enzyme [Candidatus Goldiibacteriota bacterium]
MANPKQSALVEEKFIGGHRACAGCGFPIFLKQVLGSTSDPIVVVSATGCLEVTSTIFPFSAWKTPFLHNAFENSAATCSGIEGAWQSLKKQGKYDKNVKFLALGGDGGTYDIGLQSLSGAMERRHDMMYVCYNNEAYMNTGVQRSGATQFGQHTTTSPAGKAVSGKTQGSKNLTEIMVAHDLPYVAQTTIGYWQDATKKFEKAWAITGPKFVNVYSPCVPGWGYHMSQTVKMSKMAVETNLWPLYEVENGVYTITFKNPVEKRKPVEEFLKLQVRFKHLMKGDDKSKAIIAQIQKTIDERYAHLELMEKATNPAAK